MRNVSPTVVDGDKLRSLAPTRSRRRTLHRLPRVGEFHQGTLDECDDGGLTAVIGNRQFEICLRHFACSVCSSRSRDCCRSCSEDLMCEIARKADVSKGWAYDYFKQLKSKCFIDDATVQNLQDCTTTGWTRGSNRMLCGSRSFRRKQAGNRRFRSRRVSLKSVFRVRAVDQGRLPVYCRSDLGDSSETEVSRKESHNPKVRLMGR